MSDVFRRLVWFFIVAAAISYAIFLVGGSMIQAQAIDATHIVQVRDSLAPNVHHLSGMVMVPSTCTQLSVRTEQASSVLYELVFTSWQEPSVSCKEEDTPRAFRAVLFAPATGISILATLDGAPLDVAVFPIVAHDN